jgi:2-polyprenyl-6-methoxyphenol hydroxylase-like FAD-dependent oxidoreductase
MTMGAPIGKQAIVIGAGISGLAAAQALAGHFEQVIVLERDRLPPDATPRVGTPQAWHLHGLLGGGQQALSELFPGFEPDLANAGAVPVRVNLDLREERAGYYPFPQRDLGWVGYTMSRPLIERTVRRCVERQANVTLRERCRALNIVAAPGGAAVVGVEYETTGGRREVRPADLVVDASARGSLTLALLRSIGRPVPDETAIGVDIGYATANFVIPDDPPTEWKAVMTFPQAPENTRGAMILPLEGKRWMVTASGRQGDRLPEDGEAFLAYLQHLKTPTIYNTIKHARPLGSVVRFGFSQSVWRHYERLGAFPRGLLPIGDAICRFNPVYAQGMSVAAQEAHLLRRLLRTAAIEADPLATLGQTFLAAAQPLIAAPWAMAATHDFAFPQTRGQRPADFASTLQFGAALMRLAARDPAVHKLVVEVWHLLKPQSVYQDPAFRQRVMEEMAAAA